MTDTTTARVVRKIPAMENLSLVPLSTEYIRKRVAAYARVSTKDEEQLTSYEAQMDVFTKRIKDNPEWEFAGMYADRDRSGTSTKRRDDFNRMIADAMAGKIDLILTKSVSRFARNTVDTLTIIRQLKEKGVEVYFEKENIYTLDSKGELLITIMSSMAQEESRSISENVTWGQRKRFADGKINLPYKRFLGYEKGPNDLPVIIEDEAEIVRLIYRLFLQGKSPATISRYLTKKEIPTPTGKAVWHYNTVESILTNEKYKGDALLQKQFTVDFLKKKKKINEGEVPQYYVENSHPAIIDPELFDLVQYEMKQRKASGRWTSATHCFSGKIICGECGEIYGSKVWHSNSKYRRTIWQCNEKQRSGKKCETANLTEDQIHAAFITAINRIINNKEVLKQAFEEMLFVLTDNTEFETQRIDLQNEYDIVVEMIRKLIEENASTALDQDEYQRKYNSLAERYAVLHDSLSEINEQIQERAAKRTNMKRFMKTLDGQADLVTEFDEELWYATVETVVVTVADEMCFVFRDGSKETVNI